MQPHINHARHPLKANDPNVAGRKSDSHVIVNREVGAGKRGVSGNKNQQASTAAKDEAGVNVHPKAAAGELQTRRRSDKSNKSDPSHHEPQQAICMSNATPDHLHKRSFKSLSPAESLPRNETLGGYIFVCNNDTMQEDLRRQLFGMPQRYRDSVRAIQPGLPLFLYNYTTHQLHGIYEAASFGGSNIDPTAWEDKKSHGVSRFPAQVRIRVRRLCKALEEDAFRPVLHHYDGPKFRLQLSVPETIPLLDLFNEGG